MLTVISTITTSLAHPHSSPVNIRAVHGLSSPRREPTASPRAHATAATLPASRRACACATSAFVRASHRARSAAHARATARSSTENAAAANAHLPSPRDSRNETKSDVAGQNRARRIQVCCPGPRGPAPRRGLPAPTARSSRWTPTQTCVCLYPLRLKTERRDNLARGEATSWRGRHCCQRPGQSGGLNAACPRGHPVGVLRRPASTHRKARPRRPRSGLWTFQDAESPQHPVRAQPGEHVHPPAHVRQAVGAARRPDPTSTVLNVPHAQVCPLSAYRGHYSQHPAN